MLQEGCADLIVEQGRLRVTGTVARPVDHRVSEPVVGLRLRIGAAGAVLGIPAHELPHDGVDLAALWGAGTRRWEDRLAAAADPAATRAVLEALVDARLAAGHRPDPGLRAVIGAIAAARHVESVGAAAGISDRELRRRCRAAIGYGPKALHRVLRMRRFVGSLDALAAGTTTLAERAATLGYGDQAHLSNECRALTGASPRRLIARWQAHGPR